MLKWKQSQRLKEQLLAATSIALLNSGSLFAQTSAPAVGLLWRQCTEDVLALSLDPAAIAGVVGSDVTLNLTDGQARVSIFVQDCPSNRINGREYGPSQDIHIWALIEASADTRPVVGAAQTLPTLSWLNLYSGMTNPQLREAFAGVGRHYDSITGLSLYSLQEGKAGHVDVTPDLRFSWTYEPVGQVELPMGVNHDIYHRVDDGKFALTVIQAVANMSAFNAPGTLTVVGGTDPQRVVASGTYPIAVAAISMVARGSLYGSDGTGTIHR
jgi:hypothetical protein